MVGATLASGTFGGIGERAGNVAIEQVLNGLRVRLGIEASRIDYEAIAAVTDYIEQLGVPPAAPYSWGFLQPPLTLKLLNATKRVLMSIVCFRTPKAMQFFLTAP